MKIGLTGPLRLRRGARTGCWQWTMAWTNRPGTEEALRSMAEQANNLTFEDGKLIAHGEIKDGKLVIEYPEKQEKTDG